MELLTEADVQAMITMRLLAFHDALVARGQIREADPPELVREGSATRSYCADCASVRGDCGGHGDEGRFPMKPRYANATPTPAAP